MTTAVDAWIAAQAAAFKKAYPRFPATGRSPEEDCMRYVLKALAEGSCPGAVAALEAVDRHRASVVPS